MKSRSKEPPHYNSTVVLPRWETSGGWYSLYNYCLCLTCVYEDLNKPLDIFDSIQIA